MIFDVKNIARELQNTLQKLNKSEMDALNKLPPEALKQLKPYTKDMSKVMEATRKGDVKGLNEIISKYADLD